MRVIASGSDWPRIATFAVASAPNERVDHMPLKRFSTWKREVDRRMHAEHAITIVDAGIDDSDLRKHWETRESATEFVEWFGRKYDLTPVAEWNWGFRPNHRRIRATTP
jgi:hypothetical protein